MPEPENTPRQHVEWFVQEQMPDGTWDQASRAILDRPAAEYRRERLADRYAGVRFRVARRTTTVLMEPEPDDSVTVRPTRYEVSLLPPGHDAYPHYRLWVEELDRYGWTVHDGHACLGAVDDDGRLWWSIGTSVYGRDDAWTARYRHPDLDTALRLAVAAAPHLNVNVRTAAQVLADAKETRHA
ncbi:hypothetical protein [Streptomyces aidingensis]|uniref:Uncharacterized protein n=1 Tax=Streptomyces aidingensis TaxID=910347 RepID=A0A1I1Q2M7_9ACTN|nr:hypothetical protein [Streptomyces aidingensis]SFD13483.1 hypothetical protein SAMN05421773_11061 [Streptomyces aidingensis]